MHAQPDPPSSPVATHAPHSTPNRLAYETSPYLRQHAQNPVDWYPWGEEAFSRARAENKPIFLSIGYSTCHWCHVMAHESFDDSTIAAYLNAHFVAIKVDREERPDVDDTYMTVVQALTGHGGWPMTVLLTPQAQPFFGGTYFPPRDGMRGSRIGLLTLLERMHAAYASHPNDVVAEAQAISDHVAQLARQDYRGTLPEDPTQALQRAASQLARRFDPQWGGFGGAPKFPQASLLHMMLHAAVHLDNASWLNMVVATLEGMQHGGIYDHVGGGFHRYAVDAAWCVPHFEKMLYDNAQLVMLYLAAAQRTDRSDFADVARDILRYIARDMTDPRGCFYSATDADSLTPTGAHDEGYYFTWTPEEINAVVDPADAAWLKDYYGVTTVGNFEGRTVLHTTTSLDAVAQQQNIPVTALRMRWERARQAMFDARQQRSAPFLDRKIIAAWNGLMISAMARASQQLQEREWCTRACAAAKTLLHDMRDADGFLSRISMEGVARHEGTLEDYAFVIQGLLDLFEATSDPVWLGEAIQLQEILDAHFWDETLGGYGMTADFAETLLTRQRPVIDGAEPSGNGVAACNLVRLHALTDEPKYRARTQQLCSAFAQLMIDHGISVPQLLVATHRAHAPLTQIVIVVPHQHAEAAPLLAAVQKATGIHHGVLVLTPQEIPAVSTRVAWLAEKMVLANKPTVYVCRGGVCSVPLHTPEELQRLLIG